VNIGSDIRKITVEINRYLFSLIFSAVDMLKDAMKF